MEKAYNFEDRLVRFAGECVFFCKTLPNDPAGRYYSDQILRSSGSAALNYGEAQGTTTTKDFIHKMSLVLKDIKETKVALKILNYTKIGDEKRRIDLLKEASELAAISAKMILNKRKMVGGQEEMIEDVALDLVKNK